MVLHFNVTGESWKAMVAAIEKETGCKAKYLGVPSCSYEIGGFTVGKKGELELGDCDDLKVIAPIVDACVMATGVSPEEWEQNEEQAGGEQPKEEQPDASCLNEISLPEELFTNEALNNLSCIVSSKGALIQKALGVKELPVVVKEGKVTFPWFTELNVENIGTYTRFIAAIGEMARNQKRITAKAKENENEKYAFRCFLLRLGFIGDAYKADRKLLLQNLSGSSAFKNGEKKGGEQ